MANLQLKDLCGAELERSVRQLLREVQKEYRRDLSSLEPLQQLWGLPILEDPPHWSSDVNHLRGTLSRIDTPFKELELSPLLDWHEASSYPELGLMALSGEWKPSPSTRRGEPTPSPLAAAIDAWRKDAIEKHTKRKKKRLSLLESTWRRPVRWNDAAWQAADRKLARPLSRMLQARLENQAMWDILSPIHHGQPWPGPKATTEAMDDLQISRSNGMNDLGGAVDQLIDQVGPGVRSRAKLIVWPHGPAVPPVATKEAIPRAKKLLEQHGHLLVHIEITPVQTLDAALVISRQEGWHALIGYWRHRTENEEYWGIEEHSLQ